MKFSLYWNLVLKYSLCIGDLAGVNLGGMEDTSAIEEYFFNNNAFGVKRRNNQLITVSGQYTAETGHYTMHRYKCYFLL